MAYIGGDVLEVTANHPTVGEAKFSCKAAEDGTFDFGGYMKNDDANGVSGDGQLVASMNRKRWSADLPPVLWDATDRNELDTLQQMADSPVEADWTISIVNGAVYAGKGTIVGDLNATQSEPHITVKLAGGGKLAKIA